MTTLMLSIQELYQNEPFWDICNPCKCEGHCCIGADVNFYNNEWKQVCNYVRNLSAKDTNILLDNIKKKKLCVFRSANKCLIHPVRPENCRYTPYQYVITADNHLIYSQVKISPVTGKCRFRSVDRVIGATTANYLRQCKFATLPNFSRDTMYISLNWQVEYSTAFNLCHTASEWLEIEPLRL